MPDLKKKKSFTLVEIMIVAAIIALLAAISIPNLMRARLAANESAAANTIRMIATAMESWRATHRNFDGVTFPVLANPPDASPPYIDSQLGSSAWMPVKQGYRFWLVLSLSPPPEGTQRYSIYAFPEIFGVTGNRMFFYRNYSIAPNPILGGTIYVWNTADGSGWQPLD